MTRKSKEMVQQPPVGIAQTAFERYHQELRRFLLRRMPRAEDAGDLVQEVYVRLLSVERGTLVRNPQAYLYGIAAHVAREARMRSQRERVSFDSEAAERLAENAGQPDADEMTEGLSLLQQVEDALAKLSPNHLKVLVFDRRDGLSNEQIAQRLGLSTHTVKKYLVQALTLVRESWQLQDGPDRMMGD